MIRSIGLALLITLMVTTLSAQKVQFEKTEHGFGLINKNDPAQHEFVFKNVSDAPVKLASVKASCGCTTPNWTREEIAPGKTGSISVAYNSALVGTFYKSITVMVEGEQTPIMLYIKGEVANPEADDPSNFTMHIGNTAFEKTATNVGNLDSDKSTMVTFRVRNNGPQPIEFVRESQVPGFSVTYDKKSIIPGDVATVIVNVDGKPVKPGLFNQNISIFTNESSENEKVLTVSGYLNKIWTAEELANLPQIEFEKTEFSGDKLLAGEKVTFTYKFKNTGKQDLIIESVKASCGCTASAPKDKVIKPGQSSEIVATFDSAGRSGTQTKTVTVTSNDPDTPNVVLKFSVEVQNDPFHAGSLGPGASSN